jgi:hypothetical protein
MTKKQQQRIQNLAPNGSPKYVRVYDNGGETTDRYTVVFSGHYTKKTNGSHLVLGMSEYPFHPQGVGMHSEYKYSVDAPQGWAPAIGKKCHLGKRIRFEELPQDCQKAVWNDYAELWDIPNAFVNKKASVEIKSEF